MWGTSDVDMNATLEDDWSVWIGDFYNISAQEQQIIIDYKISKDLFYEYADMATMTYWSSRVEDAIKWNKEKGIVWNPEFRKKSLKDFYLHFNWF